MTTDRKISQKLTTTVTPMTLRFFVEGDDKPFETSAFIYCTEKEQADIVRQNEIVVNIGGVSVFTTKVWGTIKELIEQLDKIADLAVKTSAFGIVDFKVKRAKTKKIMETTIPGAVEVVSYGGDDPYMKIIRDNLKTIKENSLETAASQIMQSFMASLAVVENGSEENKEADQYTIKTVEDLLMLSEEEDRIY